MSLEERYDTLLELGVCSQETLSVVCAINGYNEQSLNNIVYAVTGYQTLEQYIDCEINEED